MLTREIEDTGTVSRAVVLERVNNVRDLGGIPVQGDRVVKPGLFYRGSALTSLSARDKETLVLRRGIRHVVDLRCGWEVEAKPDVELKGVENLHIPFYDLEKVGIDYTHPTDGTKIVGKDVACEPSHFYRSMTNPLTVGQMAKALSVMFTCAQLGEPVYVHCSGGKDRAGVMSLLVLTVLGASREAILEDYVLTNIDREKHIAPIYQRFLRLCDGDERKAREVTDAHRALPANLDTFYSAIDESYGGMDAFIRNQLRVSDTLRAQLREACTVQASGC